MESSELRWSPKVGAEFSAFLSRQKLSPEEHTRVSVDCLDILSKCNDPAATPSRRTGLVLGYVQSGKTLSFLGVTAAARDNGFHLIIIVTGIADILQGQSEERLSESLGLAKGTWNPKWVHFSNPKAERTDERTMAAALRTWTMDIEEHRKSCVVVTVMKNVTHLRNLVEVLTSLDLINHPALVIDDEGDQASMNTRARNADEEPSAIHRYLLRVRQCLPHHSFLQYTATPQAPLLISLFNYLSPTFVKVLEPGRDYVGGREFLLENEWPIRVIPLRDLLDAEDLPSEAPDSFFNAINYFIVSTTAEWMSGNDECRSMMVHPSQSTDLHGVFFGWIDGYLRMLLELLQEAPEHPDQVELRKNLEQEFKEYCKHCAFKFSYSDVLKNLPFIVSAIKIWVVNAKGGQTPRIDWAQSMAHILIGGQGLGRGFTVRGLSVSYMPRGLGVGNADTLQQRARFFGYKRGYFCCCRVFLSSEVRSSFANYVEHEEDLRTKLRSHQESGMSLLDWKRLVVFMPGHSATRRGVLAEDAKYLSFNGRWVVDLEQSPEDVCSDNWKVLVDLRQELEIKSWEGIGANHTVACFTLSELVNRFLLEWRFSWPTGSWDIVGLKSLLEYYAKEQPDRQVKCYFMNDLGVRSRTFDGGVRISSTGLFFQGRSAGSGGYEGDTHVFSRDEVSVQCHAVRPEGSDIVVPMLAIRLPEDMDKTVLCSPLEISVRE